MEGKEKEGEGERGEGRGGKERRENAQPFPLLSLEGSLFV